MAEQTELIKREAHPVDTPERASDCPTFSPAVDIYATDTGTVLLADMPGVDQASVDVRLEDGVLTLDASLSCQLGWALVRLHLHNLTDADYETRGFGSTSVIPADPIGASASVEWRL